MAMALQITPMGPGAVQVAGRIDVANSATALQRFAELSDAGQVSVDVSRLTDADSITLAVLLAWAARAARQGRRLHYIALPEKLRALARLCDVEVLLD